MEITSTLNLFERKGKHTVNKIRADFQIQIKVWRRLGWGFLFLLSSCVEKVDWPIQTVNDTSIVVEGLLTNELKQHSVKLSLPTTELNQMPQAISGAIISIASNDTSFTLIETPLGSGIYISDSLKGEVDKLYTLSVSYHNRLYTAQTIIEEVSSLTPITYYMNSDSIFYYDWKMDIFFSENAMYELFFDWSTVAEYDSLEYDQNHFLGYVYTLKTIDVNQIFAAQKENVYFPAGTTIIEKKYSLSQEHADYIRALLSETAWNGNVFEASPANLPTNLSNGAIGFWGGCAVVVDTLIVTY